MVNHRFYIFIRDSLVIGLAKPNKPNKRIYETYRKLLQGAIRRIGFVSLFGGTAYTSDL